MEGEPDGVHSQFVDVLNVFAGDVMVFESFPKLVGKVGANHFAECFIDKTSRAGFLEAEHVSFGVKPMAEIDAADKELFAIGCQQVGAVDCDEPRDGYRFGFGLRTAVNNNCSNRNDDG